MEKNIILIGFMGSGKSEVGKSLAQRLGLKFIDTDMLIESNEGRSISEIFANFGEERFRDLESALLKDLSGTVGSVISTGGGMVLREENASMLRSLGPMVLLWASPDVIERRLSNVDDRPLIRGDDRKGRIREILSSREPAYRKSADLIVDVSDITVEAAVEKILEFLRRKAI